jgi:hypothetical protein
VVTHYFGFRFYKCDVERIIGLTDSFTWEELPTTEPDTGYTTNAGYIPITQKIATRVSISLYTFHMTQSAVRMVTSRETVLPAWVPFDASVSPVYEIVNLVQVIKTVF